MSKNEKCIGLSEFPRSYGDAVVININSDKYKYHFSEVVYGQNNHITTAGKSELVSLVSCGQGN